METTHQRIKALSKIKIPRCFYLVGETPVLQQMASYMGFVMPLNEGMQYDLRSVYDSGDVRVCLISAKTHVSPLKRYDHTVA